MLLVRIQTDPSQLFLSGPWEFLQVQPSTTTSVLPPQHQSSLSCEYRSPPPAAHHGSQLQGTYVKLSEGSYRSSLTRPEMEVALIPPWRMWDSRQGNISLQRNPPTSSLCSTSTPIHILNLAEGPKRYGIVLHNFLCTFCIWGLVSHVFSYLTAIVLWSFEIKPQLQPF